MHHIDCVTKKPSDISDELLDQLVKLSHQSFALPDESVVNLLMKRDLVDVYIDRTLNKVVAMIGYSWVWVGNALYLYVGNSVVDATYRSTGILTKAIVHRMLLTRLRWPFANIYYAWCASSSVLFHYAHHFLKETWPKVGHATPTGMMKEMQNVANVMFADTHVIKENIIYVNAVNQSYSSSSLKDIFYEKSEVDQFFDLQPKNQFPTQVLMLCPLSVWVQSVLIFNGVSTMLKKSMR